MLPSLLLSFLPPSPNPPLSTRSCRYFFIRSALTVTSYVQGPESSYTIGHDGCDDGDTEPFKSPTLGSDNTDTQPFKSSIFSSDDTFHPLSPEFSSVFDFSVGTRRPSSARRPPGVARAGGQKSGYTLGSVASFGGGLTRLRCPRYIRL